MNRRRLGLAPLTAPVFAALVFATAASADESGSFVIRLGDDTTGVESYRRTPARLEVDQVGRAPRVLRRRYTYDYERGALARFRMVVTPPGSTTPTQTIEAAFGPDSARLQITSGSAPTQNSSYGLLPGTVIVAASSPWGVYEGEIMKLVRSRADSARAPLWFVSAPGRNVLMLTRLGRDSVDIRTDRGDHYHARVDGAGLLLGVQPIEGTQKFGVERAAGLDLDAYQALFAAREAAGTGLGVLSPRDTVRVSNAGGATLWVDYGRPARRGRAIYGNVVPYGEVWRTGANAATQFRTDKALDFGGVVVPAGFYTLWTLPGPNGWKLIVNGETGQWGTAHKSDRDLYTIDMKLSAIPEPLERFTISIEPGTRGGVLHLAWDTLRASVEFKTVP